jgi:hypothetical protein
VVIAVNKHYATMLLPGGQFKRVKIGNRKWSIGQEYMEDLQGASSPMGRAVAAVAAVSLFMLGANAYLARPLPTASAVISLDINPSINMVVGGTNPVVIEATGMDAQGKQLVNQISVVGMPVVQAVSLLTSTAQGDGYLSEAHPYVVLGGVFPKRRAPWFSVVSKKIQNILETKGQWNGEFIAISTTSTYPLAEIAAQPSSVGRALLWTEDHPKEDVAEWTLRRSQTLPLTALVGPALANAPGRTQILRVFRAGSPHFPSEAAPVPANLPSRPVKRADGMPGDKKVVPVQSAAPLPTSRQSTAIVQTITTIVQPKVTGNSAQFRKPSSPLGVQKAKPLTILPPRGEGQGQAVSHSVPARAPKSSAAPTEVRGPLKIVAPGTNPVGNIVTKKVGGLANSLGDLQQ